MGVCCSTDRAQNDLDKREMERQVMAQHNASKPDYLSNSQAYSSTKDSKHITTDMSRLSEDKAGKKPSKPRSNSNKEQTIAFSTKNI